MIKEMTKEEAILESDKWITEKLGMNNEVMVFRYLDQSKVRVRVGDYYEIFPYTEHRKPAVAGRWYIVRTEIDNVTRVRMCAEGGESPKFFNDDQYQASCRVWDTWVELEVKK